MASSSNNDLIKKARLLWLSPNADIVEVESLYRQALDVANHTATHRQQQQQQDDGKEEIAAKKAKLYHFTSDEMRQLKENFSLMLCQSGRSQQAKDHLSDLNYICRLSRKVLDYPTSQEEADTSGKLAHATQDDAPCRVYDDFLDKSEIDALKSVFQDPEASYWKLHNYSVEPPSPYFSYLIPFSDIEQFGLIGHLAGKIYSHLLPEFPNLSKTTCVEMWAHNRPHASGHQLHFDSDNEGIGGVRHPIISSILYITEGSGGPSLVTDQKLIHKRVAQKGWLSHAKERRLVAFDGKVLHGVVPGKGCPTARRRVTLMLAFWKHIDVREGEGKAGAARIFPRNDQPWSKPLRSKFEPGQEMKKPTQVPPIAVAPIYETLDDNPWTRQMGLPQYDQVFQGF